MPDSLDEKLEKVRRQGQMKPHEWQGRVNYHSPRAAESWDTPDRLLSFDGQARAGAQKVMEAYRQQVLVERGVKQPAESLQKGMIRASSLKTPGSTVPLAAIGASRLSPFEEAFRVSPDEDRDEATPRSWLKRLFSRQ